MRIPVHTFTTLAATLLAVAALGCGGGGGPDEAAPEDTTAVEAAAPEASEPAAPDTSPEGPRSGLAPSSGGYPMTVENPMPHAMIVRVAFPGGGEIELGTVPENGSRTFELPARAGETVTMIAHDEAETHRPTASITLPENGGGWTIE